LDEKNACVLADAGNEDFPRLKLGLQIDFPDSHIFAGKEIDEPGFLFGAKLSRDSETEGIHWSNPRFSNWRGLSELSHLLD
jgi:hypothetical protein